MLIARSSTLGESGCLMYQYLLSAGTPPQFLIERLRSVSGSPMPPIPKKYKVSEVADD